MNEKTVWVVLKGSVAHLPPVMSLLQVLLEKSDYRVAFISTTTSQLKGPDGKFTEFINSTPSSRNPLVKAWQYLSFRFFAIRTLEQHANESDTVWYASLDTALALWGSSIYQRFAYILQLHELYDTHPRRLSMIAPIARRAKEVVVPEINRAGILQVWLGLQRRPTIIPNKPYHHPRQRFMEPTTELTRKTLQKYKTDKSVILYQGHIGGDRNLLPLAEAMKALPDCELWLMGQDHGFVDSLLKVNSNIKYLGYIPAPLHLEITSQASIGIISYDLINLNNLYCAPNKIWEYTGFGIPVIANDVLSLRTEVPRPKIIHTTKFTPNDLRKCIQNALISSADSSTEINRHFEAINLPALINESLTNRGQD